MKYWQSNYPRSGMKLLNFYAELSMTAVRTFWGVFTFSTTTGQAVLHALPKLSHSQ